MKGADRIIVALDHARGSDALALAATLAGSGCRFKIGKELFTREGPAIVRALHAGGAAVFLDLKYHDIPNTVAAACQAAAELGVWMLNVHATGGREMLRAAGSALAGAVPRPLLVAVTVLTSLDATALDEVGVPDSPAVQVRRLAALTRDCGLDGVVCSAQEIPLVRALCGPGFLTVTPGIRPPAASADDQQRIATPARAVADGGDYLVIGRPITRAADPLAALEAIAADVVANLPA